MLDKSVIGYCTNVHAGIDIAQIQQNLQSIAVDVRQRLAADSMGVGLWIPSNAASQLTGHDESAAFRDWLGERGLLPFTINGFPYGNFHEPVVKHRVYQPTWIEDARRDYTLQLADILHAILPEGACGSISTLPIGWGHPGLTSDQWQAAAGNFLSVAERLRRLEDETGRRIMIAIEPEPGCAIDMTEDMIRFFDQYLSSESARRYITVCHDVCHAVVMYEDQSDVLRCYADAGIAIGKIQVSSAIEVRWTNLDAEERSEAMAQLQEFAEDRYLHQTVRKRHDGTTEFVEDLPSLVAKADGETDGIESDQSWRIHFHVPIFLERFGRLWATRDAVTECLSALESTEGLEFSGHLEAETYAWSVLPEELSVDHLADGIANELDWLSQQVQG